MGEPEPLLLTLMLAVGGLSVLAGVLRVPYPIVLVLGGLVLGFVPGLPPCRAAARPGPGAVPTPLLFQEAFSFSPRELRAAGVADGPAAGDLVLGAAPDPATVRIGHAALISAVVIAVRVGWGFTIPYLIRVLDRRPPSAPAPGSGWWRAGAACAARSRWPPRWPCRFRPAPASRSRIGT